MHIKLSQVVSYREGMSVQKCELYTTVNHMRVMILHRAIQNLK